MENDQGFGVFIEDDEGPELREYYGDLDEAKRRSQRLADIEGLPSVIFTIKGYKEIARFTPSSPPARPLK